ncbi:MAG: hypothetical protein F6K65_42400 [Moorea sp. SIO3C2]|nr:hypothetical protein [Moorena sp. SIO3C2]
MASGNNNEDDLRRREVELRQKEQEIRLRELELELNKTMEPPVSPTVKHVETKKKNWLSKIPKFAKFGAMVFGSFLVVVITWKIAALLVPMIIVGAIAFIGYKLYLEGDDA